MPADHVATQRVTNTQGGLEIDATRLAEPGRAGEALGRHVNVEAVALRIEAGHRHAGTVQRDAVAQADAREVARRRLDRQPQAERRTRTERARLDDGTRSR